MSKVKFTSIDNFDGFEGRLNSELLWTNASPTSAFSAQTINLDMSKYSTIIICFRQSSGSNFTRTLTCVCANVSSSVQQFQVFGWINGIIRTRFVDVNDSKVYFGVGSNYNTYGNGTSITDNTVVIPTKIYGLN